MSNILQKNFDRISFIIISKNLCRRFIKFYFV